MMRFIFMCMVSIFAGFLQQGCHPAAKSSAASAVEADVPQYSASKGLYLPEQTRNAIGLSRAEVTEGTVVEYVDVTLRVFSVEEGGVRASGTIARDFASALAPGHIIQVSLQNGRLLDAEIDQVIREFVGIPGRVEILVSMTGVEPAPVVGDFLTGRLALSGGEGSIVIPRNALLECSEGTFVYAISGERFVRTAVEVGRMSEENTEIVDGLYAGDEVVTDPVQSLWMTELAAVKGGQSCCLVSPEDQ